MNKAAFFSLINFLVPCAITSLFFPYKLSNYIFHIYPFFVIIGAYGVVSFYDDEIKVLLQKMAPLPSYIQKYLPGLAHVLLLIVLFSWLPLTTWFKLGVRFPNLTAGQYNLVYTHRDWKWAANYVNEHRNDDDIVLSTIPLTLVYYGLTSDYNLNNGMNSEAVKAGFIDPQNRLLDPYSGTPTIMRLDELKTIIDNHPGGWLVTDHYIMSLSTCVPEEIARFITENLEMEATPQNGNVLIYRWNRRQ